jgi:hypothetical protein
MAPKQVQLLSLALQAAPVGAEQLSPAQQGEPVAHD